MELLVALKFAVYNYSNGMHCRVKFKQGWSHHNK